MTARVTAAPLGRLVGSELSLALARPRTGVVLATLLVVPLVSAFGLRAIGGEQGIALGVPLTSVTEFTALTLAVPVVLVAADAFAAERAHRTLDQLVLAPVGAARLTALKSTAVLVMAGLAALVTASAALLAGLVLLPLGPYDLAATAGRTVLVGVWTAGQLAGLGALVLVASMLLRRPSAVIAAGLAPAALGVVLPAAPGWLAAVAPTGNWMAATTGLSAVPVDWSAAAATKARAAVQVALGVGITAWLLARRE